MVIGKENPKRVLRCIIFYQWMVFCFNREECICQAKEDEGKY